MKIFIIMILTSFITTNIFAKDKQRILSKIDYEIISASLIKKQISFIEYIGSNNVNILDDNLRAIIHDIMFSENLLIENKKFMKKNQYFIQNDKKLDRNLHLLIQSFKPKNNKNSNKKNINKRGKNL